MSMTRSGGPADETRATGESSGSSGKRRVDSEALFGGGREILIVHGKEEYRLRITSTGKLILTK